MPFVTQLMSYLDVPPSHQWQCIAIGITETDTKGHGHGWCVVPCLWDIAHKHIRKHI